MPNEAVEAFEDIGDALAGWQSGLFTRSVWYTLALALIACAVAFVLIRLLKRLFARRAHGNTRFFYQLLRTLVIATCALVVMMTISPLANIARAVLAGSGLVAVVIGIAAQAALGNVFSGISIGLSRPFVIGETIEIVGRDILGSV